MRDLLFAKSCDTDVLSDNVDVMSSRFLRSRFAVLLACVFGLLLLVGTPMRPVSSSASPDDKAVAAMVDDLADIAADGCDTPSCDDNTNGGMDDILHPFDVAYLWTPVPHQAPASLSYDLKPRAPARLLRPPEAA